MYSSDKYGDSDLISVLILKKADTNVEILRMLVIIYILELESIRIKIGGWTVSILRSERVLNTNRNSNIELLRVVLMIMLIASHYVHNSGILELLYSTDGGGERLYYSSIWNVGKTNN